MRNSFRTFILHVSNDKKEKSRNERWKKKEIHRLCRKSTLYDPSSCTLPSVIYSWNAWPCKSEMLLVKTIPTTHSVRPPRLFMRCCNPYRLSPILARLTPANVQVDRYQKAFSPWYAIAGTFSFLPISPNKSLLIKNDLSYFSCNRSRVSNKSRLFLSWYAYLEAALSWFGYFASAFAGRSETRDSMRSIGQRTKEECWLMRKKMLIEETDYMNISGIHFQIFIKVLIN